MMAKNDAAPQMGPAPQRLRLFFAAWPPVEVAQALQQWARESVMAGNGRVLPAENVHLTLAFLGDTAAERAPAAIEAARGVEFEPHAFRIDRAGHFRRSEIVWVGPAESPAALAALVAALGARLAAAGFAIEQRAFVPHVSLIRRARKPRELPPLPALEWPVTEFVLVRSTPAEHGSRYEIVERFPMQAPEMGVVDASK